MFVWCWFPAGIRRASLGAGCCSAEEGYGVKRGDLSDDDLVAGMIATVRSVAGPPPDTTTAANGWIAARTSRASARRELEAALTRATRAENEARLLRSRAVRAELECELLRVRFERLREEWSESTLGHDEPPEVTPPRVHHDSDEPPAAGALRDWLRRPPVGKFDKNGAA
jgi:hypothetical protein